MLGVHVDVHEDWVMLWVAAMYNVLAILSMADMAVLAVCRNCGVHEQCWVCIVCTVCMVYGLYDMLELRCKILLLLNMVDMDRWKTVE